MVTCYAYYIMYGRNNIFAPNNSSSSNSNPFGMISGGGGSTFLSNMSSSNKDIQRVGSERLNYKY